MFWRWKWLFLFFLLALPTAAYLLSVSSEKVYKASVILQVEPLTPVFETTAQPTSAEVVNAAARLIDTSGVAQEAANHLRPRPRRFRSLLDQIEVVPDTTAGFITIRAESSTARRAADIANAFAQAVQIERAQQATSRLDRGIQQLEVQLRSFRGDRDERRQLSTQLQRFRALRAVQDSNAQVVEPAVPPRKVSSPKPLRTATLALIIALIVGVGAVFLAENVDRRVRRADELESITGLPLLSTIPRSAYPNREHSPQDDEAFQRLRANLTYFNIDRSLSSVLVTSPVAADGKTTVATNLAKTLARSGKDVILVDADLRRPQVAQRLDLPQTMGLSAVLVSDESVHEALVEYPIESPYRGKLQVLPAGAPPPNPSELLASQRMRTLLEHLAIVSDMVIIDTSPLLTVSDTTPLLEQVSGIVMVAQVGQANKDAVSRFRQVVSAAHGTLLGVVATGVPESRAHGYYGYYSQQPEGGDGPRSRGGWRARRRARDKRDRPDSVVKRFGLTRARLGVTTLAALLVGGAGLALATGVLSGDGSAQTSPRPTTSAAPVARVADYQASRTRWESFSRTRQLAAAADFMSDNPGICSNRRPETLVGFVHEAWGREYADVTQAGAVMRAYCERAAAR
jgi:capsular exopolysaccharide synthesis family protein